MDRGAWWATVHGVAKSRTWLSDFTFAFTFFLRRLTLCCYSCWPSTIPEGVQGGGRRSVLQGIWWDRSLDSWMFLGTDFMILHLLISREALNPFMVTSSWLTKAFCKMSASCHWTPPSPKPYTLTFPHCRFGAGSQSYLRCCLPGCSPHSTPNKT